jgi:hypothetical protein
MRAFRAALGFGAAAIVGLSAFDLFPIALVVAAVLVPLLSLLYLWDVDIYEDEPLPVLAATVAWSVVAGVTLGIASRHLASSVSLLTGDTSTHEIVWLGVVLPLVSVVLMLLGPLALLPYRRFNDVLDGVTFGASCAVTILAAEAVTNSADLFRVGLTAPGEQSLWIARLLTLGIALPVLGAGAIGAACGILWLRYRSPAKDRVSFGPLGSPPVAVLLAGAALVAAHLFVVYLEQWEALGATALLAGLAMVALRRVIDLGLRQESAEIAIGPPIRCPNCGRETPRHTFCAECGVALRALPKHGAAGPAPQPARARLSKFVMPAAFVVLIAATIGISIAVIEIVRPAPVQPPCDIGIPCSHARTASVSSSPELRVGKQWRSAVHVGVHYDESRWTLRQSEDNDTTLVLVAKSIPIEAIIKAVPSSETPAQLLEEERKATWHGFNGLELDSSEEHAILEAEIGFVPALSAMYSATSNDATSPGRRTLQIAFEAATRGGATVIVEAITIVPAATARQGSSSPFPFAGIDALMDAFEWEALEV